MGSQESFETLRRHYAEIDGVSKRDALLRAAKAAGLQDGDAVDHADFVGARTRYDAGEIDVDEAVRSMKEFRPQWFAPDYQRMSDAEFEKRDQAFRDRLRAGHARQRPSAQFRDLDAGRLTPSESEALRRVLAGCAESLDRADLEVAQARQKAGA